MLKRIVLFISLLISCILLWIYFPSRILQNQLFLAAREKCDKQINCKIHLHEITSFKWDKAYFFPANRRYSNQDIKNITGVIGNFQKENTLAIFTFNGKFVKASFFDTPILLADSNKPAKTKYFDVSFFIRKEILQKINYSGNLNDLEEYMDIYYYELTNKNDLLYVWFASEGDYYQGYWEQCWVNFTNLNQVHLYHSKTISTQ